MIMRLVQVKIKPELLPELCQLYEEKVIPLLGGMQGCLYASLIQSVDHADECMSLTLWDTREHADEYERSGMFKQLLTEAQPYLAESSEWKIQLSKDLTIEYEPVIEEPVVNAYQVTAAKHAQEIPKGRPLFVRIVSPQIREGQMEEFKKIFNEEILPELRTVKGCRYTYLTESIKEKDQIISVTIWDTREDAEAYQHSGVFNRLMEKVKHTFWKMQLERETGGQVMTSDEVTVEGYRIVTGKSFT
ncbi:MAG: antibiotic biosynthesis monooxygenase [Ignavibacteria bacterium]|nr:antibiotic biosynthesis monooxygenase [Ignavibacteria bacterium]MBI3765641.1 antibiotic biosynthesis monooxygenase [Ignavibacteriales bacterium]